MVNLLMRELARNTENSDKQNLTEMKSSNTSMSEVHNYSKKLSLNLQADFWGNTWNKILLSLILFVLSMVCIFSPLIDKMAIE